MLRRQYPCIIVYLWLTNTTSMTYLEDYTLELNMFNICALDSTLHYVTNQQIRYVYNMFYFITYYFTKCDKIYFFRCAFVGFLHNINHTSETEIYLVFSQIFTISYRVYCFVSCVLLLVLSCVVCNCCWLAVCIVLVVLYMCCYLMCICCTMCAMLFFFLL